MAAAPPDDARRALERLLRAGTAPGATDGLLLERFLEGPEAAASDAFAVLVDRHGPAVLRACRRVLDDPHDAEDVAQAAFLVLARRARAVRRRDSVASFLLGTALRLARRLRVESARRRRHERQGAAMAVQSDSRSRNSDAWPALYEELDRLPEALRDPLVLCYLEGLTNEQAAGRLRVPVRTVQRRLAQGRERLRRRLERRGVGLATVGMLLAASSSLAQAAEPPAAAWAEATARAAARLISGRSAAGLATAEALTLAEEAVTAMLRAKLRLAAAALLALGAFAAGLIPLALAQRPADAPPAPPRADAPDEPEARPLGRLPEWVNERPRTGPGRTFRLQVVDDATGKPVPFANVRLWVALRTDDWRTTDADGRLDILHSTGPADTRIGVDVWGDGFAMQRHNWGDHGEPIPDGDTVRLQPGEALSGRVTDEQGNPVPGATVYLWSHNYKRKDPHELLFDLRATTGPDGRWRTAGAPETTGELLGYYITHPDYLSDREYAGGREKPSIESLRDGTAVSVLKKGPPIEGRVLDADGQPVADALVFATEQPMLLFGDVAPFATATGPDGRYRLAQVQAGDWHVVARAPGHAPATSQITVETAIPQVELRLGRPTPLRVRVVEPDGKPVAGAFVNVDTWNRFRCLGVYRWTDADGRAEWDGAPDDPLDLNVSENGHLGLFQATARPTPEELVVTLKPSVTIAGRVRDAETGKSVQSAKVEIGAVDPQTGEVAKWVQVPEFIIARRDLASYASRPADGGQADENRPPEGYLRVMDGYLDANFVPGPADTYKLRIVAEGYAPFVTRAFRRDEKVVHDYDITLQPAVADAPGVVLATALDPDGQPLAGARVFSAALRDGLWISADEAQTRKGSGREIRTGPDGTFPLPPLDGPGVVLIRGEESWALASKAALDESKTVRTRPYGRVEGRFLVAGRPLANRPIRLQGLKQDAETMYVVVDVHHDATTDADGRFAFEKVIPIHHLRISRNDPPPAEGQGRAYWSIGEAVRVEPGETARIVLGEAGRPVVGRVEPPAGWDQPVDFVKDGGVLLETHRANTPYPPELFRGKSTLQSTTWSEWSREWRSSPEGRAAIDSQVRIRVALAPDGTFRIDDVPPGEYHLVASVGDDRGNRDPGPFEPLMRVVTVPPIPGGRTDDPLDLGTLTLRARTEPEVGQPAPAFEVTTVTGERLRVPEDFAGKFLLIQFAAAYSDQSRLDIARFNDVHARFGDDPRFAMLTLLMDEDTPEARAYIEAKGQPWPQAIIGPPSNPIASAYGGIGDGSFTPSIRLGPAPILIAPDGRVVATTLYRNPRFADAVAEALGRKP
jgi:RNA polymerase sigma factor (sigma-70 family)